MSLIVFGVVLPWLVVGLGCWIGLQLIRQNGRMLLRLEALEQRLANPSPGPSPTRRGGTAPSERATRPEGLPAGAPAPSFELPDLDGQRRKLSDFLGRKLLLIFFNPRCGYCVRMVPDLAGLPTEGQDGHPLPLVISTGDVEANRKLVEEHGIRCPVLLQEGMEVASAYRCHGTPIGYLINDQGQIASEQAVGAQALLALVNGAPAPVATNGNSHAALGGKRSVADSKIPRSGLPATTPAPAFTLPRLEGGELSLEEYRGRNVLLVFSDAKCGPCSQLNPLLEQAYRRSGEVPVLMVSRGDSQANQAKVAEHGLTFPIVLQRQWEISRLYGMFATPIAYWIDAAGKIAAEVAVGVEPILSLYACAVASDGTTGRRCQCGKLAGECDCNSKKSRAKAVQQPVS